MTREEKIEERKKLFLKLWHEGVPIADIAKQTKLSVYTLRKIIALNGLTRPHNYRDILWKPPADYVPPQEDMWEPIMWDRLMSLFIINHDKKKIPAKEKFTPEVMRDIWSEIQEYGHTVIKAKYGRYAYYKTLTFMKEEEDGNGNQV